MSNIVTTSKLRSEFEHLAYPGNLEKDNCGDYIDKTTQMLWEWFVVGAKAAERIIKKGEQTK